MICRTSRAVQGCDVVTMEADTANALFLVRYAGNVLVEEAREGSSKAPALLAPLQSGFRLLANLSDLVSMELGCAPFIERVMDLCQEKGVAEVVRVIPDPRRDIGMQIMSRFHYDSSVRIVTCQTLTEALAILSA